MSELEEPKKANTMLETNVSARFVYSDHAQTDVEQSSRMLLQKELEIVTQRLHTAFRLLIIELLDSQIQVSNLQANSDQLNKKDPPIEEVEEGTDA